MDDLIQNQALAAALGSANAPAVGERLESGHDVSYIVGLAFKEFE